MSETPPPRAGLPAPDTVLRTFALQPPLTAAATDLPASPATTIYQVLRTDLMDPYDTGPGLLAAALAGAAIDTGELDRRLGDQYQGTARKAAKISISPAERELFSNLVELIDSLPEEDVMIDHHPPMGTEQRPSGWRRSTGTCGSGPFSMRRSGKTTTTFI